MELLITLVLDALKDFPMVLTKQKLQMIISLLESHTDANKIGLSKHHEVEEGEDFDPLKQLFQWICLSYELTKEGKIKQLEIAIENRCFDGKRIQLLNYLLLCKKHNFQYKR